MSISPELDHPNDAIPEIQNLISDLHRQRMHLKIVGASIVPCLLNQKAAEIHVPETIHQIEIADTMIT